MTPTALCPDCGAAMQDRGDGLECPACPHVHGWEPVVVRVAYIPTLVAEAASLITRAEQSLGPLTHGQRVDLLLDNLDWLGSCDDAKALLTQLDPKGA